MPSSTALPSSIEPMLAKVAEAIPDGPGFMYEPKWDGFRAIVFRNAEQTLIQGRDLKSLNRYFPELVAALHQQLPRGCVLDGEIVIATHRGLDFAALQHRIHPAPSRVARLAKFTPARFVAFDLLTAGGKSTMQLPQSDRRVRLERMVGSARSLLHLTPMTRDRDEAVRWLEEFKGAGFDGVMAKLESAVYQPGKRAMLKIKHALSADCVVAGFRFHKDRTDAVGSLLLGLYDDDGVLQHVGVTSTFPDTTREQLLAEIAPLREAAPEQPGWEALRPERVCEVQYEHLQDPQARHFREGATFLRWRLDKPAADCRFDQLAVTAPHELSKVFFGG